MLLRPFHCLIEITAHVLGVEVRPGFVALLDPVCSHNAQVGVAHHKLTKLLDTMILYVN